MDRHIIVCLEQQLKPENKSQVAANQNQKEHRNARLNPNQGVNPQRKKSLPLARNVKVPHGVSTANKSVKASRINFSIVCLSVFFKFNFDTEGIKEILFRSDFITQI